MPPTRLPERPKPPTGKQMLADIASADDNDVVFLTGLSMDLSDLTPTTPEAGGDGGDAAVTQAALAQAERRESAQRAYHKALELLDKVKTLEGAPARLETQFMRLSELGEQMSKAIKDLQESSSHLIQSQKVPKVSKVPKTNKKKR